MNAKTQQKLWTASFISISIASLFLTVTNYMTNSTFSLYVKFLGSTASVSGLSTTLFSIANVIARLVSGRMADKSGRKTVLLMGGIAYTIPAVVFGFSHSIPFLLVMRFIQGYGYAAFNSCQNILASDSIPEERMGEGMGYFSTSLALASAFGPQLALSLLGESRFLLVYLVMAAICIAALILSFVCIAKGTVSYEKKGNAAKESLSEFLHGAFEKRAVPCGLVAFMCYLSFSAILTFLTLYSTERGFEHCGLFFTISAVTMFVTKIASGKMSDKYGTATVMVPTILIGAANFVILSFTHSETVFLICGAIHGVFLASILPVMTAVAVKRSPADRRGSAICTFYIFVDVGVGIGALLWGLLIDSFNFGVMFMIGAAFLVVAAILCIAFFKNEKKQVSKN